MNENSNTCRVLPINQKETNLMTNFPTPAKSYSEKQLQEELVLFDLNEKYGPALGLTRLERFQRALKLNIEIPEIVKVAIYKHPNSLPIQSNWFL